MAMIGRVRSGQGLGAPRMADPDVMALLERTVGFPPVPGTLNVMLDHPFDRPADTEYVNASLLSPDWAAATGQAGYWLTPMLAGGPRRRRRPGRRASTLPRSWSSCAASGCGTRWDWRMATQWS